MKIINKVVLLRPK